MTNESMMDLYRSMKAEGENMDAPPESHTFIPGVDFDPNDPDDVESVVTVGENDRWERETYWEERALRAEAELAEANDRLDVFDSKLVYVAVYELWRNYGGPEEGGWWWTSGKVQLVERVERRHAEARRTALEAEYPRGQGTQSCGSVIYSGGDFTVEIQTDEPTDWPTEVPHYE